ncbi:LysR family transcriptional regulator [Kutzneria buriramensis]|uniref:DNA-binding transcriptional LysR family regulator n=1 Tax=Kutzneria buriramensis TaxID=1045776 RepID=A0A3E0GX12_9PSEU|nr:LysR family transcriptional regulator [Kutzneria buriramensis]REH31106.1 DNA-binding transcriptional LysR family regulator [Kutzneria buriramensis]
MLNPIHLRTLTEAVRARSFAETARLLGYTTSAVSQQIAMLERAVGAQLFERSARSVRPTAVAERMALLSRDALAGLSELEREVQALTRGDTGTLRLASFATANARIMASALTAVVEQRPGVDVLLDEGDPDEVVAGVLDGGRDAGVVFAYDLDPRAWPEELVATPLLDEPLVLVTSPAHRLAARGEVSLVELADERWICTRGDTAGSTAMERLCVTAGFTPRITMRSNDYGVVCSLVHRGLGIALAPRLAVGSGAGLGVLNLIDGDVFRRIVAVHRPSNLNPLLPIVLDALQARCAAIAQRWNENTLDDHLLASSAAVTASS